MNAAQAKLLVDLKTYIEGRFPPGESTSKALSVTGEPYVVFSNVALIEPDKNQLEASVRGAETLEEAIEMARAQFDAYASDKSGHVYWRVEPELELKWSHPTSKKGGWWFYMRLLISNKPPISKED